MKVLNRRSQQHDYLGGSFILHTEIGTPITEIDFYSRLAANKYLDEGRNCYFFRDIVLRPLWAFFKVYFINRGFLDGKLGFIFSMNHYFYTMAKYVRYYYLKNHGGKI